MSPGAAGYADPWPPVTPSAMYTDIRDTIGYTREFADDMRTELSRGIENLEDVILNYVPNIKDIDTTIPPIDGPSFPSKPGFSPLDLDNNWPDELPLPPEFMDYGEMDFAFVAPTPPSEIDGNFNFDQSEYTSEMWYALFSKVHDDILNGGTGLTDLVHAAIVAREQETRRLNQDRETQKLVSSVGSKGFDLPSGQIASLMVDITKEIINKDQDSLNNITIKDFELAQQNTQFAVTTGADLEKMLRATFQSAEALGLDAAKATKEYLIRVYDANVKLYLAKWEGTKVKLEALVSKIEGISSYNDGLVKVFLGRAQVYESQISAITVKNKGMVDVRAGEISLYSTEIDVISKEYSVLLEEAKFVMEGMRLEVLSEIEKEKITLSAYTDKAKLAETVAEAVSNISAQSIASALGAINTSMGHSYSGSENRSESFSNSESHSFEEEGA
jgi:hypothetical protein